MKYSNKLKMSLTSLTVVGLIGVSSVTTSVKAAEIAGSQQTDATLTFKAQDKTKPTKPVDPKNPGQQGQNPADPGDPDNHGTNAGGPLSIDYAPNFDFGIGEVASSQKEYTLKDAMYGDSKETREHNPFVQVSDNRGTNDGWALSASISGFTNSQGSTTKTLDGASLSIQTKDSNQAIAGYSTSSDAPKSVAEAINLTSSPQNIIMASKGQGMGAWIQRYDPSKVILKVPGGTALIDTVYKAKVTWTLSASPVQ